MAVASCTAPTDNPDLDLPLRSKHGETTFNLSPSSGDINLRDAVAIAKVIRRYRNLDAAEKALVKLAVRRHFDGLVALEVKRLEKAHATERRQISRISDATARRRADAELSARLLAEAARRVSAKLGDLLAVPLKTSSNQSVVTFARVVSEDVRVADAAYELDVPNGKLASGKTIDTASSGQGLEAIGGQIRKAQVIAGTSVSLK